MLNSPIEEIKNRLDIVEVVRGYIKLQKAGANYRAVCPFHSEKKPSFFVSPARQIWHCFGACSEGGDIFKFVMKIEGVEFGDALRLLAQKAGLELKKQDPKLKTEKQRLYEISDLACRFFERQLEESLNGKEAKKYLLSRGLKEETIKKWKLGYSPNTWQGLSDFLVGRGYQREEIVKAGLAIAKESEEISNNSHVPFRRERAEASSGFSHTYDRFRGRIMFPVFDFNSQVIGFGARIFENEKYDDVAKYVNTPATLIYDKSRVLYGLNKAAMEIRKKDNCVLVEGYLDAIMASQAGFENVVAVSGTALTLHQLKILKRYSDNLFSAFDMDVAGDSATKRGIDLAQTQDFNIKVVIMPQAKDPADIISENPDKWRSFLEQAKTIHDFYFENTLSKFNKNTLEGKKQLSKFLLPVIKRIPNKIEQSVWLKDLAEVLETREEDVLEELKKTNLSQNEFSAGQEIGEIEKELLAPKSRKELLEERMAILLLKSPEIINLLKREDLELFSPQAVEIINCLKENRENDQLNYLSLKAEIENIPEPGKEFKDCLRELRFLVIRNRLDGISKEIKREEEKNNFEKVQELVRQFNQYSKQRSDLEISEI